jgi:hypothetical protein
VLGGLTFAACMLILIGFFQVIAGLTALFGAPFYSPNPHYIFKFDTTTWGWIHLLLGLLLGATGFGLTARQVWAGGVAILLAGLSALANFIFLPFYPVWSIVVIALAVWVIWALTRPEAIRI